MAITVKIKAVKAIPIRIITQIMAWVSLLAVANAAFAHTGHTPITGFWSAITSGLAHPVSGLDHIVLALGLGLAMSKQVLSKQAGAKQAMSNQYTTQAYKAMAIFAAILTVGFVVGLSMKGSTINGFEYTSLTEWVIKASLVVLAIALWQKQAPLAVGATLLLAVSHGIAHGQELPATQSAMGFAIGMLASMVGLYFVGLKVGQLVPLMRHQYKQFFTYKLIAVGIAATSLI